MLTRPQSLILEYIHMGVLDLQVPSNLDMHDFITNLEKCPLLREALVSSDVTTPVSWRINQQWGAFPKGQGCGENQSVLLPDD